MKSSIQRGKLIVISEAWISVQYHMTDNSYSSKREIVFYQPTAGKNIFAYYGLFDLTMVCTHLWIGVRNEVGRRK